MRYTWPSICSRAAEVLVADPHCIFCSIVAGTAFAEPVTETERALAFVNANPAGPGHMLVIPKAHARDIWDVSREDGAAVWDLVRETAALARRAYGPASRLSNAAS